MTVAVDTHAALKISQDQKALTDLGFEVEPPLFEIGSQDAQVTQEGYKRVQREFESKPFLQDVLEDLITIIQNEKRQDITIHPKTAWMDSRGGLHFPEVPEQSYEIEKKGLVTLANMITQGMKNASFTPRGFSSILTSVPAYIRSDIFNKVVPECPEKFQVKLRTRNEGNIYACVSNRYRAFDIDKICHVIMDVMGEFSEARGEATYDGYRASIRALWHNYHDIQHSGAGDVFRFGIEVETSEDRTRALRVSLIAWINQCLNYLIVDTPQLHIKSIRHFGDKKDMKKQFRTALVEAKTKIEPFLEAWNHASTEQVIDNSGSIREVFTKLVERGYGRVPGSSTEALVESYVNAWNQQPGFNRVDIINAMTRAAHTNTWGSVWTQREIEKQASQLLFVKNLGI